ncbi:MAG: DUF222 domain-containing protein [Candidatus Dormibacteraeota bacterium]|nr:DUF222 domain-containing protein [Candidatus Dormibacteraeota bacterium]
MIAEPLVTANDPLSDLVSAIDQLQSEDLQLAAGSELGSRLKTLRSVINRLESESTRSLEVFDRTQGFAPEGHLSAASWLRHRCNIAFRTASNQVQMARRLPQLPRAQAAFAAGEVSSGHVSLITRTADQVGMEPVQEHEEVLVEAAKDLDTWMFRRVTMHLRYCVDQQGMLKEHNRAHDRCGVWLSEGWDGFFELQGRLDPEGGAILSTALAAVEGKPVAGDTRLASERRRDALVDLARQRLDAGDLPSSGGAKPHLIVTADLQVLAGQEPGAGMLNWEQLVPAETLRRLACDCSLTTIVNGPDGNPVDVSKERRTVPPATRRAIMMRDQHCRFPGCDRPAFWTDGHHLKHWIDGGPSEYWNIWLLCRLHHRMVHEGGWKLEKTADGKELIAIPP